MEAFVYGGCRVMQEVMAATRQAAACDLPVLLQGETGTGKGLLAQWIHAHSRRRKGPVVEVDVPSLTLELMASLLFGHEKGAFTGDLECRKGFFERASGSTVFLDEIGELSVKAQARLLRVLDETVFYRVGGDRPIRADVRIIAATNRDLRAEVRGGDFRPDLYYRLDGIRIELPPLRQRRGEIPVLVEHFLRQEGGGANGVPRVRDLERDPKVRYELATLSGFHLVPGLSVTPKTGEARIMAVVVWLLISLVYMPLSSSAEAVPLERVVLAGGRHGAVNGKYSKHHNRGRYKLTPVLSIGSEDDDNYAFGVIKDVAVDPEGDIYVLDLGFNRVQVYDSDGVYLRTIGKEGKGPGEISGGFAVDVDLEGKVFVLDYLKRRIIVFGPGGDYLRDIQFKEGVPWDMSVRNGLLYVAVRSVSIDTARQVFHWRVGVACYDLEGHLRWRVAEYPDVQPQRYRGWGVRTGYEPRLVWTVDRNGNVYVGYSDRYEIRVFGQGGALIREFGRVFKRIEVSSEEKQNVLEKLNVPGTVKEKLIFPKTKPAFYKMILDDAGNLWVNIPQKHGSRGYAFDIFSPDGTYLEKAVLDISPWLIKNGYAYSVTSRDAGSPMLKKYRMERLP